MAASGLNPAPPAPRAGGGGSLNGCNALRDERAMTRLGHVALRVQDMERASAFYQALGLRVTWHAEDWTYLQSPETGDGVALLSPAYTAAGPHFAFHLADRNALDAVHGQLQQAGQNVGAVHDHRDGTASFYLQDPEGNWLEVLYEPPSGIPSNIGAAPIAVALAQG
jgi:catechol-2,3-dioxygenase